MKAAAIARRRPPSHGVRAAAGWLFVLLLATLGRATQAHKPSDSYLTLSPQGTQVAVRWDVALRDLDNELGLDADDDGQLSWGEVRKRERDIESFALPQLKVRAGGAACQIVEDPPGRPRVELRLDRHSDGTYAVMSFVFSCRAPVAALDVEYHLFAATDPTHRGILRVIAPSPGAGVPAAAVLGPDSAVRHFELSRPSIGQTLRDFINEGIWHIWLGFDHVLFLLSLLLPAVLNGADSRTQGAWPGPGANSMRGATLDVLKTVTAFTLAHSITLTLAVLDLVSLPSRFVESAIALTVVLASLNNLRPVVRDRRWLAAFAFGLIHGFGFAAALKDLGLSARSLAVSLFGFNLGVELGQLAIVVAFMPLAYLGRNTRFYRVGVLGAGSAAVAIVACCWFVERAFDVDLSRIGM
jgi:hypothetical protein